MLVYEWMVFLLTIQIYLMAKQGIMSRQMYIVHANELMARMLNDNLGCTIVDYAYSAIFYADDIVLI